jgi:hypothetical protein
MVRYIPWDPGIDGKGQGVLGYLVTPYTNIAASTEQADW